MGLAATTFDTVNKGASVTLSGGNLVATVSSGTGSVRSSNRLSGLTYFEMTIGATLSGSARVGCCNPSFGFSTLLGADTSNNSCGYDSGGTVKVNNVTVATIATYTTNSRIGVAIDNSKQLIWFRVNNGNWNNDVIGNQNPVGGVGGISIAALVGTLSAAWGGSATSSVTAAFASASWTDTAPTGFSSPDTLGAGTVNPEAKDGAGATFTVATASQRCAWVGTKLASKFYTAGNAGSPGAAGTTISGVVQELGANVAKTVYLFDGANGKLLGCATSNGSTGAFSIPALARTNVFAVALDPTTYRAQVYDNVTPM